MTTRSVKRIPLIGVAVLLTSSIAATLGATATAVADSSEPAPNVSVDSSSLTEIIVTAQRREQNLQDVGISVTALDAKTLEQLGIVDTTQLVRAVPGLKVNSYSPTSVVFNIRGVSQNDYGDQQEPPVAVYQDDSYASTINLSGFPVFDLARAEVLRGPQGTLFGRNADGGAIQLISNKPTKNFEGYAAVTTGSFEQLITEGAVSGPLSDALQARFAFIRDKDDGFFKSIFPDVPSRGANDHYAMRFQLAWQPVDGTNVALIYRFLRAPQERQAGMYSLEPACPNAQGQGQYLPPNQTCAFWAGFLVPPGLPIPGTFTGLPGPGTTASGYRNDGITPSRGGNPFLVAGTAPSYVDRTIHATTLRVDSTLGGADLVWITDYQSASKYYVEDADGSPDNSLTFFQHSDLSQWTQEIRLSDSIGSHQLVGGIYGMKVDGNYTASFSAPLYGYLPEAAFSQNTRSEAVFGQDEWHATDRLTVISGLRYWHDERRGSYHATEPSNAITITFNSREVTSTLNGVTAPLGGLSVTPADADKVFSGTTARFELDYHLTDKIMPFASWNRGSKSGGFTFSTGTPFAGAQVAFLNGIPYRPEVLDSFEVGFKSEVLPSTTFNANAYYYVYKDYQAFAQLNQDATVVNLDANAVGLEAEINSHPVTGLTLQVGVSSESSRVKHILLPDLVTYVDHSLPQAPHFAGNGLVRYEFPVGGGMASVQSDIDYTGHFCYTVLCAPVEQEHAYAVAGARVGYAAMDRRWDVAAFVNNLTDHYYRSYAYDSSPFGGVVAGVYAKPRTWGLTGTYRFGRAHP